MNHLHIVTIASAMAMTLATGAHAQTAGNLLGAPLVAGGGVISAAAAGHAQIAPTVNRISPSVEPATDTVTNTLAVAGFGVTATGAGIQNNGVLVGASSTGGKPLVSVGATAAGNQGSLAAVLNGRH